ncbi:MAG: acyl-CoA dehydrogenase [Candidatus Marinimicrobia bacterium]|jgi:alkylation response protein AidB-like acyl-CoA dehydrogenase|nr:acyl-CoA dehydrogenase [Candidatus Neomarinimicrobiota bacterium]MBT3676322.1 acyl-CoA dehydrogenase [Candidatus Neomarinimicrobiota bacterium]MBT3762903.1 acyl-CoA dehydrogenase [Candidatus Neomarinimicrobiota bacterium]MBT4068164.1 acyl-CoA dehydrogenase [Candidatus Neomarinimicrobiota bacterium]MBT4270114.1 acyl-CoA dehydrogenase [Candidatus Neomarinimicrobiota bacterium]
MKNYLEQYRKFVENELIPIEPLLLNQKFDELLPKLEEKRSQVKQLGLWAPYLKKEHGGMGFPFMEFAAVSEILGRSPLGHYTFNCQAPDIGNIELLSMFGSEQQKNTYLKPLMTGEIRSCFGMVEPDRPGSNPTWLGTSAVLAGDDYVLNGRKWFTSSADGAAFCIVMAQTNPDHEKKHRRSSMIIVPTDTPGYEIVRNISVMGEPGVGYFSHGEVTYTNVRVPKKNLIQNEGDGFRLAQERLGPGRIHHCMRWIGICERAFDLMCQRAIDRNITPAKTLADQPAIRNWIAESRAEIDASRLLVLACAKKIDQKGAPAARTEISLIKFHVANVLINVLDRAIQTHGALGITDDTPLSFWYRHERGARIYDGPDEVHKLAAARRILKKYES